MVHCWVSRYEALGYPGVPEALVALGAEDLDRLAVGSGREAEAAADGSRWYRFDVLNDLCLEEEGHGGPHRFVPEDAVVIGFKR